VKDPTKEKKADPKIKNEKCSSSEWRNEFILMLIDKYEEIRGMSNIPKSKRVEDKTNEYIDKVNKIGSWWHSMFEKDETLEYGKHKYILQSRTVYNMYKTDNIPYVSESKFKYWMDFNNVSAEKGIFKEKIGDEEIERKGVMVYKGWKLRN